MSSRLLLRSLAWLAPGALLVAAAVLTSNAAIETALWRAPGSLSWGPSLFRALLVVHGCLLSLVGLLRLRRPADALPKEPPISSSPRWHWGVLPLLMVLAVALRLWRLETGLWFDEVLTLLDFVRSPLPTIVTSFPNQNQHMLYSILARVSVEQFGENVAALRLPSVFFGVASIWALYLLARRVLGSRQALFASALMTVSYHHIWFSQNARGYTGLLFFSMLATWLWMESRSRQTWHGWVGYSSTVALGMWTNLTMVFVVAAHFLIHLFFSWRSQDSRWAKPLTAFALSATLSLQLYALALPEFLRTALHEISPASEWTNPLWAVTEAVQSLQIGWSGGVVVLLGATLVVVGLFNVARQDLAVALAMVLPGLLGAVVILASRHNLWPRFFFFSMGFALLVVTRGTALAPPILLSRIAPVGSHKAVIDLAGATLTGLLLIASIVTIPRCYALPKQDFIGARDYVEGNRRGGEAVVAVGLAGRAYGDYFAPHWRTANSEAELDAIRRAHDVVWLVYTLPEQIKGFHPGVWEAIERDFHVVKVFPGTLGGGEVNVCRDKSIASASAAPVRLPYGDPRRTAIP